MDLRDRGLTPTRVLHTESLGSKHPYYLAVVGSRDFTDMDRMRSVLDDKVCRHLDEGIVIVSGGARGADRLAMLYADENHLPYVEFAADWERYGRRAGYIRNSYIVDACDECIAFWDRKSRGTLNTVRTCRNKHKPCQIVDIMKDAEIGA